MAQRDTWRRVRTWAETFTWRRGRVLALVAVLVTALLVFHRYIPDQFGNLGSLTESFLPWLGAAVPLLLAGAVLRRSLAALVALVLPVAVWLYMFGPLLLPKEGGAYDFTAVQHNVWAHNTDPGGTVRVLEAADPDVISLVEVPTSQMPAYEQALAARYPYRAVEGTVGLWSRYPLRDTQPVDLRIGWERALRTVVEDPHGPLAVYVAHLPSVRVKFDGGFTANERDNSADALGNAIAAEPLRRVLLLGDLNGTMNDRSLNYVTSQLRSAQGAAGDGFGFSYPVQFPMTRIDQIMSRGITPVAAWTLPRTGSDHLPVAAHFEL
jgi:vancomycin resistance protein VanJ